MSAAGTFVSVEIEHPGAARSGSPSASRGAQVVEESQRSGAGFVGEDSGADLRTEIDRGEGLHAGQQEGERVHRRRKFGHRHQIHNPVRPLEEGGGARRRRRFDPVEEAVEEVPLKLIRRVAGELPAAVDLPAARRGQIVALRVPQRSRFRQRRLDVLHTLRVEVERAVDVVQTAGVGVEGDGVEVVDVVRIGGVELFAPLDDVHAEVAGHPVPEQNGIRAVLFEELPGVFQVVDVVLRRHAEDAGFVGHLPAADLAAPALPDKLQIAVVNFHRRQYRTHLPAGRLVEIFIEIHRQLRTADALRPVTVQRFLAAVDGEVADQTEERFDLILFEHIHLQADDL